MPELYISIRTRIDCNDFFIFDKDRFESRYLTTELLKRYLKLRRKCQFYKEKKKKQLLPYGKGWNSENVRLFMLHICIHFSVNGKYLSLHVYYSWILVSRLFINGNKLCDFLEKNFHLRLHLHLHLHKTGNLEKVSTKPRIYVSNIYTEKENPLKWESP